MDNIRKMVVIKPNFVYTFHFIPSAQIKDTDVAKLICGKCEGQVFTHLMHYQNVQDTQRKIADFSSIVSQVRIHFIHASTYTQHFSLVANNDNDNDEDDEDDDDDDDINKCQTIKITRLYFTACRAHVDISEKYYNYKRGSLI